MVDCHAPSLLAMTVKPGHAARNDSENPWETKLRLRGQGGLPPPPPLWGVWRGRAAQACAQACVISHVQNNGTKAPNANLPICILV